MPYPGESKGNLTLALNPKFAPVPPAVAVTT